MFERLNEQCGFEIVIPAPLYVIPAQAGIQFGLVDSGSRPE